MKSLLFALSLPSHLCLLIFNVHTLMSDSIFCSCSQSCHRYNGDCRLEVNDPVPSSLGSRSFPRSGFGTVPTLRSSQEASKTVVTARLHPRTVPEGLQRKDLRGYHSYFHQNCTHLNKKESGALAGSVGRLARGRLISAD